MKSLRSTGSCAAARACAQVLGRALERGAVGEHGKAGRTARFIGLGQRRRIEVGADQALGRARLLDLGDQGKLPAAILAWSAAAKRRTGGAACAAASVEPAGAWPWRRQFPRAYRP